MTTRTRQPRTLPASRALALRSLVHSLPAAAIVALSIGRPIAEERNLKPNYDFVIEVDGTPDKGWQVLSTEQNRSHLILIAPGGGTALHVSVPEKSVRPVDRHMLMKRPDGSLDLLAGAISRTLLLPLSVEGSKASFVIEGKKVALAPRPPLVGPQSVDDLILDRPLFGEGIRAYAPEAEVVTFLRSYSKPTDIEVYFGSWCSVCEAWIPKLVKSLQASENGKIRVQLIGVARDFQTDEALAKKKGIRGVPTFIIRQEGVEIGRIVGPPEQGTIEAAVAQFLKARS